MCAAYGDGYDSLLALNSSLKSTKKIGVEQMITPTQLNMNDFVFYGLTSFFIAFIDLKQC
jgi:hypothetical protein